MKTTGHKFVPHHKLLPGEWLAMLSLNACALYAGVWNRMAASGRARIDLTDGDAAMRGRIDLSILTAAQSELVRAGLIDIQYAPDSALGVRRAFYTFVDEMPDSPQ